MAYFLWSDVDDVVLTFLNNSRKRRRLSPAGGATRTSATASAIFAFLSDDLQLQIELVGSKSNRQGIGARIMVTVLTPDGSREIHRAVGSLSSFGGSPSRQEIGIGDATDIVYLVIQWPDTEGEMGERQVFKNVPLDASLRIVEGEANFERLTPKRLTF